MSHVQLGGDEQQVSALRFLLAKWGVTVGRLGPADTRPTVLDCDAVILHGNCDPQRDACLGTMPDGSGAAAGWAAPLIFINDHDRPRHTLPDDWMVLPGVDPDGSNLQRALQVAVTAADARRNDSSGPEPECDRREADSYLHFLGHELRSPLTAIKTSLEVLAGELGDLEPEAEDKQSNLKMLTIALRNVRRLQQTVDWSQDLLAAQDSARPARLRQAAVRDLAEGLREVGAVTVVPASRELELLTDPELLEVVATQMIRAVSMACPGQPISLGLGADPDESDRCHLVVTAADGESAAPSVMSRRTQYVRAYGDDSPRCEVERLARFMVAQCLVTALGGEISTPETDGERPTLVLSLPLAPQLLTCD